MPNEMDLETLLNVMQETLEEAAYIFTEPVEEEPSPSWDSDHVVQASLDFSGDRTGSLALVVSKDQTIELAANLLGIEIDDPDAAEKAVDALGEVLNIAAGILMEGWFGGQEEVQLGTPKMKTISTDEYQSILKGAVSGSVLVTEEDCRIEIAAYA